MRVEVLPWLAQKLDVGAAGRVVLEEELPAGTTLRKLLEHLRESRAAFVSLVFDSSRGALTGQAEIAVNGVIFDVAGSLDGELRDGDTVTFMPGLAGGEEEPRFIVDVNVGKLAKWLRILGYDTLFINPIDDGVLVEIALREGRVVLTRDTHIPERRVAANGTVKVLVVEGDKVEEQLRFAAGALGLRGPFRMFSRCLECNLPLEEVEKSALGGRIPPYVYRTQERYVTCPRCGKIYWAGTHWKRMRETVERMLGEK